MKEYHIRYEEYREAAIAAYSAYAGSIQETTTWEGLPESTKADWIRLSMVTRCRFDGEPPLPYRATSLPLRRSP